MNTPCPSNNNLTNYPGLDERIIAHALKSTTTRLLPDDTLTQAVVDHFRCMSHADRCKLASALNAVSTVLQQEIKFQPRILPCYIKVRVRNDNEAFSLQEHLISWGCGFHRGRYPLVGKPSLPPEPISSVHVTPTGAISLNCDPEWFDESSDHEVSLERIMAAASPLDVVSLDSRQTTT